MTVTQFHEYAKTLLAPTEPLFLLVPKDKADWKPTENSFTAGQLMNHMATALRFNGRGIQSNDWQGVTSLRHIFLANRRQAASTVDEAVMVYRETSELFLNVFASMSDEEFQTGEIDSPQLGRIQKWRMALFAVDHHINHKAELFMYLKLMRVKVNSKDLYGMGG